MPADLEITTPGRVRVTALDLRDAAGRIDRAAGILRGCAREVRFAVVQVDPAALVVAGVRGRSIRLEIAVADAESRISQAVDEAERLALDAGVAADEYDRGERAVTHDVLVLAGQVGATVGTLWLDVGLIALAAASDVPWTPHFQRLIVERILQRALELQGLLRASQSLLGDPAFLELVRIAVTDPGDMAMELSGVPDPIARLLRDDDSDGSQLEATAAQVIALAGMVGGMRETKAVALRAAPPTAETVPRGFADRAGRIPRGADQIRIERMPVPGRPDAFEVYLGGTNDFSPIAGSDPFDLTSDVRLIAGVDSGAYRAAEEAMRVAGIEKGSEVTLIGYSEGGIVAARLAEAQDFDVKALVTFGAPVGQIDVPTAIPWAAFEHSDDLVPVLGGTWATADPVLVSRNATASHPPSDTFAGAHDFELYRDTAALADGSRDSRLVEVDSAFAAIGQGSIGVVSTLYTATRIADPPPPAARQGGPRSVPSSSGPSADPPNGRFSGGVPPDRPPVGRGFR